ncbi:hypothetical protein [Sulfitobacter sp. PS-8MA]|uniref:hypothetical protein n=1 Tax=Sulfitobacter sp. PS-8MA TaxID=3237707 RepID=UPI0034C6D8D4
MSTGSGNRLLSLAVLWAAENLAKRKAHFIKFTLQEPGLLEASPEPAFDNLSVLACDPLEVLMPHVSVLDHANQRRFYQSQKRHPAELAEARLLPIELT